MKAAIIIVCVLTAIFLLGWLGLKVKPKPFDAYPQQSGAVETMPLPKGLPAPVERYYRVLYGENVPLITSVVITGRATLRVIGNIPFPGRFRFTHEAGQSYRHYIETTWFGLPLMKVNERYLESVSRVDLPFGTTEDEPKVNQGANLGLWAESVWFPSIWLTDERVRWEALDADSAVLVVPFEEAEEHLIARFDPETGLLSLLEAMRYQGADSESKTLWITEAGDWGQLEGQLQMTVGAARWLDQATAWAIFDVDEVIYNVDVNDYLRTIGP